MDLLVWRRLQFHHGRLDAVFGDVRRRNPRTRRPLQDIPRVLQDHRRVARSRVSRTQTQRGGALLPSTLLLFIGNPQVSTLNHPRGYRKEIEKYFFQSFKILNFLIQI